MIDSSLIDILIIFQHIMVENKDELELVSIYNTIDAIGKEYYNLVVQFHFKIYPIDLLSEKKEKTVKEISEIYRYRRKIECNSIEESILISETLRNTIYKHFRKIKVDLSYNQNNLRSYDILKSYKDEVKKEIEKEYQKELDKKYAGKLLANYKLYQKIYYKLSDIHKRLKSNKNSYILSKLTNGELNREDLKGYPEIIDFADTIETAKLFFK